MGNAGQTNYAASKAGMVGFSKSLAREIGSRGITVNVVAPGFIDTGMTKNLSDDQRAAMLSQVPLGRLGAGDDIANSVLFLASGGGDYITGETLHAFQKRVRLERALHRMAHSPKRRLTDIALDCGFGSSSSFSSSP